MNTIEKCSEVLKQRGWTQRELAKKLGMSEQNMTHVMKGRRDLPAHALAIQAAQLDGPGRQHAEIVRQ